MTLASNIRIIVAGAVAASALFIGGCATPSAKPGEFVTVPTGTVIAFERQGTGSFSAASGAITFTERESTWQGRPVTAWVSPQAGTNLYTTQYDLIAVLNPAGQPAMSFDPPLSWSFPLEVGKTWTSKSTLTMHAKQQKVPYEVTYKVEAYEDVTVPAGTFKAFRVAYTDPYGEVVRVWTSPSLGNLTFKRVADRTASHPQGAGHFESVLTSYKEPK